MQAGESVRAGSGQGHEEARTGVSPTDTSPLSGRDDRPWKEGTWENKCRAKADFPGKEVVFHLLIRTAWPSISLINIF